MDEVYNHLSPYLLLENESNQQGTIAASKLFAFDPNTATDNEFLHLGFSDKQVKTIRNYLDKGWVFHSKIDFFKIRVISEKQKRILSDWVVIENTKKIPSGESSLLKAVNIDLNSADSIQLKQLPGVGPVLAKRIVKYRDLLGGFYSIDQLKEVYGLSEQTAKIIADKLTVDISRVRKLDLNFADVNELSRHPYLKKNLASKIVRFRTKNGSIRDLAILLDSMVLNIDEYNRIEPYF